MSHGEPDAREAERQLGAAAARYREAAARVEQGGRSAAGDATAAGALARATALVAYTLQRAEASGMDVDRMAALSGWDAVVVRQVLTGEDPPPLASAARPGTA